MVSPRGVQAAENEYYMSVRGVSEDFSYKIGVRLKSKIGVRKRDVHAYIIFSMVIIMCLLVVYMDSIHWTCY